MVSTAECVYELNSSLHQLTDERDSRGLPCPPDNEEKRIIFRAKIASSWAWGRRIGGQREA
jgi:hypothetical protein